MTPITIEEDINNPNVVKAVVGQNGQAPTVRVGGSVSEAEGAPLWMVEGAPPLGIERGFDDVAPAKYPAGIPHGLGHVLPHPDDDRSDEERLRCGNDRDIAACASFPLGVELSQPGA